MGKRVWLPFPDTSTAHAALGEFPAGLDVDYFLAEGDSPDTADEVEFLVAPYMYPPTKVLARIPIAEFRSRQAGPGGTR